ncbi:MAG: O-succinylbenzoic acid--CoA ligase, partial [Cytophagia bacterium]|nr:O-succinylbenzoic acid--CoA ligase [Cytophagia bacterium]
TVTGGEWIQTNDLVRQTPNGFEWLGRSDLAVNSGGIKIQIEELEKELCTFFQKKIWVWKEADKKLGEKVIGMTDDPKLISQIQSDYNSLKSNFKKYHLPKEWVLVKQWLLTSSGKPDRNNTLVQNK